MTGSSAIKRLGRIDEVPDLKKMDLLAFNEGVNPFGKDFTGLRFRSDAKRYRSIVEAWGFAGRGDVADLGSGFGQWSMFLAEVNTSVVGYESYGGGCNCRTNWPIFSFAQCAIRDRRHHRLAGRRFLIRRCLIAEHLADRK